MRQSMLTWAAHLLTPQAQSWERTGDTPGHQYDAPPNKEVAAT